MMGPFYGLLFLENFVVAQSPSWAEGCALSMRSVEQRAMNLLCICMPPVGLQVIEDGGDLPEDHGSQVFVTQSRENRYHFASRGKKTNCGVAPTNLFQSVSNL